MKKINLLFLNVTAIAGFATVASAQSTPPNGVVLPPTTPTRIEQTIPTPLPSLPPSPTTPSPPILPPTPTSTTNSTPSSNQQFFVKHIQVLGSTVLKDEIAALIKPFENQTVTFDDLINLRTAITQLYIFKGYVTSGAFLLNNQSLDRGTIKIQVVEGELEKIEINGLTHLQSAYVRSRLELATQTPLNRHHLEESLQLLQSDPLFTQVNAELTNGSVPGRNRLRVRLKEANPVHVGVVIANSQSPSVGSIQGTVFASDDNLLGFGDRLAAEYGRTSGTELYNLSYQIPVNAENGTFSVRYGNTDNKIIENPFADLNIRSNTKTFSVSLRQPIVRSSRTEFALGVGLDLRRSQTYLFKNIPFSFTESADNGRSKVTVVRFFQDWVHRDRQRLLAARSQFSFGINAFNATVNDTGTDGRFFSWLGQIQWVQQLSPRALLVTHLDAQLTPNSLLSLERFNIGGIETVRGYRQNQLVSDNGILGGVELRLPLTADPRILQLTPFVEIGGGWNHRQTAPDPALIASLGLGLQWQIRPSFDLHLDYGIPLVPVSDRGNSLQDSGLYFSLRYQPF